MVPLKIVKIGDSLALVLPKAAAAELHAVEGETLYLSRAADGTARLMPDDATFARQLRLAREGMARYRDALHALAKR